MAHDAEVERTGKGEKRLGACDGCPAKADWPDDYRERACKQCELKQAPSWFTQRILQLYEIQEAGFQLDLDEVSLEEVKGLAKLRAFLKRANPMPENPMEGV